MIDLTDTSFLDSSGLRALIGARQLFGSDGGTVRLAHPNESVVRLLDITGLSDYFSIDEPPAVLSPAKQPRRQAAAGHTGAPRGRRGKGSGTVAERQKPQLDQRFALAMRAARMGSWSWDIASGRVEWDAHTSELFGMDRSAFAGTFDAWEARLHPDDREWVAREIAARRRGAPTVPVRSPLRVARRLGALARRRRRDGARRPGRGRRRHRRHPRRRPATTRAGGPRGAPRR